VGHSKDQATGREGAERSCSVQHGGGEERLAVLGQTA